MTTIWKNLVISIISLALSHICLSQNISSAKDYKLIRLETNKTSKYKEITTYYEYKGIPITTLEQYYETKDDQEKGLTKLTYNWSRCSKKIKLVNRNGKIVGGKYLCNKKDNNRKTSILGYSYFDTLNKVTVIIGNSSKDVENFAKGICPFSYQLYNDLGCPEFPV